MAEQETQIAPEVLIEAKSMGWSPLEQWRGDPEKWVDADAFVERGHTVLPILRKVNKDLEGKLGQTTTELVQVKLALAEQAEALKAIKEFQSTEVKRQVEARIATLRTDLRTARTANDEASVGVLEDALDEAKDELREIKAAPALTTT